MCTMIVKYLHEYGWVGCKNRDRNYKPDIKIIQSFKDDVESLIIYDELTKYSEGVNEFGIAILNTATAVDADESAAQDALRAQENQSTLNNPDGLMLRKSLKLKTPLRVTQFLADNGLIGHTVVFNKEECYILECGMSKEQFDGNRESIKTNPNFKPSKLEYAYTIRKVAKTETVIRTNHGSDLDWLGYQSGTNSEKQTKSRESSESRLSIAIKNSKDIETPDDMIKALSSTDNENTQLNPLRLGGYNKKSLLKTSCQICLIPKNCEMIYVPYWCTMTNLHNFNSINNVKSKTYVTIRARVVTESYIDYLKNVN